MDQWYFTNLILVAVGDRTKKEFASLIGISPEYLSRLINPSNKIVPSKDLLKRVADASDNKECTYEKLLKACGYDIDDVKRSPADIGKNMTDAIRQWKHDSSGLVITQKGGEITESLQDACSEFLDMFFNVLSFCDYQVDFLVTGNGDAPEGSEYESYINIKMSHDMRKFDKLSYTIIDTFFVLVGHWSRSNKFYVENILLDGESLCFYGAIPQVIYDGLVANDIDVESLPEIMCTVEDKMKKKATREAADRLLDCIFGKDNKRVVSLVEGYGFYLDEMPESFIEFALNHFDSWMTSDDESKIECIKSTLESLRDSNEPFEDKAKVLTDLFVDACPIYSTTTTQTGWQAVVSNTMSIESGYSIEYWKPDDKDEEDWGNHDTIIYNNSLLERFDGDEYKKHKAAIKDLMIKYARELHLPQVEYCYYQMEHSISARDRDVLQLEYDE